MKKGLIPVADRMGLARDPSSNAILNVDQAAYKKAKDQLELKKRKIAEQQLQSDRINRLEERMDSLDTKLDQILKLLRNSDGN